MRLFTSKSQNLIGVDICATSVKLVDIQRQQGMFHLKSGGVLKSMLSSDVTIIDIKEHQIKRLKVVIKLF